MTAPTVDPAIAGTRFSPHEFAWDWTATQSIARAAGCSIDHSLDRRWMLPDSTGPGHPMILFNGALAARNRAEVMDRLIGGYEVWKRVGRWGSGALRFAAALPREGRARVNSALGEVGATAKGHALVRFTFAVDDAVSGTPLADGWMLLFLLDCAPRGAGKLASPRAAVPEGPPGATIPHGTPRNVTFDWAMASGDWNTTHFESQAGNPAPLVHGPRNMSLVLHDVTRCFTAGALDRVRAITLGTMPAPHFPTERTETHFWRVADDRVLGRLVVPATARIDGGAGDKIIIDQIEILLGSPVAST